MSLIDPVRNAVDIKMACIPRNPSDENSVLIAQLMSAMFNTQEFLDLIGTFLDSKANEVEAALEARTN